MTKFYNNTKASLPDNPHHITEVKAALSETDRQFLEVCQLIDEILTGEVDCPVEIYNWKAREYEPVSGIEEFRLDYLEKWHKNRIVSRKEGQHGYIYSVIRPGDLKVARGLILSFRDNVRVAYAELV